MFLKEEDKSKISVSDKDNQSMELRSQISDFEKKEDDRVCKNCGFFGCENTCIKKESRREPEKIEDKGQSFIPNEYGLIDREKTEKLFQKRKQLPSPTIKDEELQGCQTTANDNRVVSKEKEMKRVVSTAETGIKARSKEFMVKHMQGANRFSQPQIDSVPSKSKYLNPISPSQKHHATHSSNFGHKVLAPASSKDNRQKRFLNILKIKSDIQEHKVSSVGPLSPRQEQNHDYFSA